MPLRATAQQSLVHAFALHCSSFVFTLDPKESHKLELAAAHMGVLGALLQCKVALNSSHCCCVSFTPRSSKKSEATHSTIQSTRFWLIHSWGPTGARHHRIACNTKDLEDFLQCAMRDLHPPSEEQAPLLSMVFKTLRTSSRCSM